MESEVGSRHSLGYIDYAVLAGILLVSILIGMWANYGHRTTTVSNYFLADRDVSFVIAGFSFMATFISGIAICGHFGEMFVYGFQLQYFNLFCIIALAGLVGFISPVFHQFKYVSVFEYLEKRFDVNLRLGFSIVFQLTNLIYVGVVLYIPCVSLSAVSGIPYYVSCLVVGFCCTTYCVVGGYRAVVWTDVMQACLMLLCFLLIVINGSFFGVGISQAISDSIEGSRFQTRWIEDTRNRYSFWNTAISGITISLNTLTINHATIQRLISVKNCEAAKKVTYVATILYILLCLLMTLSSCFAYSVFKKCDPLSWPEKSGVQRLDQLLVYYLVTTFRSVPGLTGLAFSGVVSGSLSSISSLLNSFAAIMVQDILKPHLPNLTRNEARNLTICKLLTAFYGILAILMSFIIPYLGGAFKIYTSVIMPMNGPLTATVLLGMFVPRSNARIVKISLGFGLVIVLWLAIGMFLTPKTDVRLPVSIEECPWVLDSDSNITSVVNILLNNTSNSDEFSIYKISTTWTAPIGLSATILIGVVLSFAFGPKNHNVDPRFLSKLVIRSKASRMNACENAMELERLKI